jgi:AraC-like DNA-binding protein
MVAPTRSGITGSTTSPTRVAVPRGRLEATRRAPAVVSAGISGAWSERVGTLRELPTVLRRLGFDPDAVIAEAGIDPRTLDDGDNALASVSVGSLLSACAGQTGCPYVGLLVGARARTSCFGVVGLLMQHAPTVAAALHCLMEHGHLYHPNVVTALEVSDGTALLHYAISPADEDGGIQVVESALATGFRILRALCGPDWVPSEVLLSHAAQGGEGVYRQIFEVPVRFDDEATGLVFPARWLEQPVPGADPAFRRILERQVGELEHLHDEALSSQLRRSLRSLLLRKGCTAEQMAHLFAMHRRTMSRRLRAEGHGFQNLVDEVRYDIARHLLTNASMPLAEVAVALGYSEASAFTRAFKRWSGLNPKAWRLGKATVTTIPHAAIVVIGPSVRPLATV